MASAQALEPTTQRDFEAPESPASRPPATIGNFRSKLPQHLQSHLNSGRDWVQQRATSPLPAPLPTATALDRLLTGGLPQGQLVELIGHRSSGRFSVILASLASATSAGEAAALVDLGDAFDPQLAVVTGVDLERLLWVRPGHLKQTLICSEVLLAAGFPLVVIDLGIPPVPGGRGMEASWLRLAKAARSHQAALLVSSPYRVSGTAAAGVVTADGGRALWSGTASGPRLLAGLACRLTLQKMRRQQGQQGSRTEALRLQPAETSVYGSTAVASIDRPRP
jgi:hypothetical protein